jgi:ABC-2 type transport system permease protein
VGLLLITWAAILVSASQFQTNSEFYNFVTLSMLPFLVLEMTFLSVGVFLGSAMKQYKRASGIAVSLLLGTFLLSIIAGINPDLDFLKYFTPFKFFNPGTLLHEARIEPVYLAISAGIIVLSMLGSYLTYTKRDLYI